MSATLYRTDKNGTKYYVDTVCPACGGTGVIPYYYYNEGGRCFTCDGSGSKVQKWKEYTPEYEAILNERRHAKAMKETPKYNEEFLADNGFNKEGNTWIVLGNTYNIKDELKEKGAKFLPELGWHFNYKPEEYETMVINIDSITYKNDLDRYYFKEWVSIKEEISSKLPRESEAPGEFVGIIGEKLTTMVKFVRSTGYETRSFSGYGTDYINVYIFEDSNNNTLVWKTSSYKKFEDGRKYELSGVVKDHKEYKTKRQTILKNCKLSEA